VGIAAKAAAPPVESAETAVRVQIVKDVKEKSEILDRSSNCWACASVHCSGVRFNRSDSIPQWIKL
jgi:hypothetical protein